ncbi:hypothetical protein EG329_001460 [Mollisiaceae sp. DMI_Dod_QoI]|nr:hypothetical protein EG329_001460 [Helotiales sp. DMI_Dod_QoI]
MPELRISRVSSEAPEVVPGQFLTTSIENRAPSTHSPSTSQTSDQLSGQHSRAHSWLSDRKSRLGEGTRTPQVIQDDAVPYQPKVRSRRVFSLLTTIILAMIAFFLGGGIGGGIAGAVLSSQKSRSTFTSTSSSPATVIVDQAGCPLINNSTYSSSTGAAFMTFCSTSILSTSGQNIELSNSVQSSFDTCLDKCATFDSCVGATWYMFDPTTPSRNSICFLKNGTGEEVVASDGLSVEAGGIFPENQYMDNDHLKPLDPDGNREGVTSKITVPNQRLIVGHRGVAADASGKPVISNISTGVDARTKLYLSTSSSGSKGQKEQHIHSQTQFGSPTE